MNKAQLIRKKRLDKFNELKNTLNIFVLDIYDWILDSFDKDTTLGLDRSFILEKSVNGNIRRNINEEFEYYRDDIKFYKYEFIYILTQIKRKFEQQKGYAVRVIYNSQRIEEALVIMIV